MHVTLTHATPPGKAPVMSTTPAKAPAAWYEHRRPALGSTAIEAKGSPARPSRNRRAPFKPQTSIIRSKSIYAMRFRRGGARPYRGQRLGWSQRSTFASSSHLHSRLGANTDRSIRTPISANRRAQHSRRQCKRSTSRRKTPCHGVQESSR